MDVHRVQVYILELVPALLDCLHALCHPHSIIYLAFYERSQVAGDLFWHLLPERFTAQKIPEESFGMKQQAENLGLFVLRPKLHEPFPGQKRHFLPALGYHPIPFPLPPKGNPLVLLETTTARRLLWPGGEVCLLKQRNPLDLT